MNWRHFLAEIECTILGHIDFRGWKNLPQDDELSPVQVEYIYADGHRVKVADNICYNCGHFLGEPGNRGFNSKIRSQRFTPIPARDYIPDWYIENLMCHIHYREHRKQFGKEAQSEETVLLDKTDYYVVPTIEEEKKIRRIESVGVLSPLIYVFIFSAFFWAIDSGNLVVSLILLSAAVVLAVVIYFCFTYRKRADSKRVDENMAHHENSYNIADQLKDVEMKSQKEITNERANSNNGRD